MEIKSEPANSEQLAQYLATHREAEVALRRLWETLGYSSVVKFQKRGKRLGLSSKRYLCTETLSDRTVIQQVKGSADNPVASWESKSNGSTKFWGNVLDLVELTCSPASRETKSEYPHEVRMSFVDGTNHVVHVNVDTYNIYIYIFFF